MPALAEARPINVSELSLRDLVAEYLVALEVAGRSHRTIEWYRAFLHGYLDFVARGAHQAVLADLSAVGARRWLMAAGSKHGRELSPSSLAGRARTLRAFGGWVWREVGLPAHPIAGLVQPKVPDVLVPSLCESDMRNLLAAASTSRNALRDQAVVLLLLDTGIRLSELTALRVRDVDLVEGRCLVRGKGSRERLAPIGGRCRRALRSALAARGRVDADGPLFIGRDGRPLPGRSVQQALHRLARTAGISGRCSPHVLRHSFARAFLANGGDVFTLQRILGHSPASLQVTRRYVRLIDDDIRAAHRRASPVDRL